MHIGTARTLPTGQRASVTGTVTVAPGFILNERTFVIQDESGGIAVRLALGDAGAAITRGAIVRARGEIAAPYGNQELRAEAQADIEVIGSGGLPAALELDVAGLSEQHEGMFATLRATIDDIVRYDSGAVSISVHDDEGEGRVYAFTPVGLDPEGFHKGQRVRATGIVGQRASSTGAADGHRLWLRAPADLQVITTNPNPNPNPTGTPRATDAPPDEPTSEKPPRVAIDDAQPGATVTIVGVVTSKPGLIDSEGRRVTVEDRSGAILVRYPEGARPAGVGRVIRATGEVGTWYGARQLEAATTPRVTGRGKVEATVLREPPSEAQEWQLVTVRVGVTDTERSGDSWRAEATLGETGSLPIVGLSGAAIPSDRLEAGRSARVTGIVRRAHPSASDQRFAVAPRSSKDVRLGKLRSLDDEGVDRDDGAENDWHGDGTGPSSTGDTPGGDIVPAALGTLEELPDQVVRIGGRIVSVSGRRLTVDDGTDTVVVRLAGGAGLPQPALAVGEVINATGHVRRSGNGPAEVVVASAADLRRAASLAPVDGVLDRLQADELGGIEQVVGASVSRPDQVEHPGTEPSRVALMVAVVGATAVAAALLGLAAVLSWRRWSRSRPA